jgi:glycosyltransferase involved in cell wall biosynthesis
VNRSRPVRKLRIAQVAPLYESVPPAFSGGTERVVSYLTEELVALGHDVTLFASGDSLSRARLIAPCARALRSSNVLEIPANAGRAAPPQPVRSPIDPLPLHYLMLEDVYRRIDQFDVVHFHLDHLHFPLTRRHHPTSITTLHGRLDLPYLPPLYDEYCDVPVVSISNAQREPLPKAAWLATVPHGLPLDLHAEGGGGDYLAFVGRISPEKRIDRAIAIAEASGLKLKIAARIDGIDAAYFKREIAPLMTQRCVQYLGELDDVDKSELLRGARALVFPVDWPEPFGLAMLDAMACGTPVIAYRRGAIPEVIDDGVTGFVVDDLDGAIAAVGKLGDVARHAVRQRFEARFSASAMARAYVEIYRNLIEARTISLPRFDSPLASTLN